MVILRVPHPPDGLLPPLVSGSRMIIGLSLIQVGLTFIGGGGYRPWPTIPSARRNLLLAGNVLAR